MIVDGVCIGFKNVKYQSKKEPGKEVVGLEACVVSELASPGKDAVGQFAGIYYIHGDSVVGTPSVGCKVKVEASIRKGAAGGMAVNVDGLEFLAKSA